ncbi:dnaK protein [Tritrichomonas foetus]|uniref:DnaK protein n=1 Tax=Tritrichomonas foetus TaxID=1144522 RepID=A0A1J4J320_9EUKA|nr:dnaK protein [Tritrichomonas foetus]|eukprot:OHS93856.1 dnaK protein [Tritrichomonas foetus]
MILIFCSFCSSTVLGIDLGHKYLKASLLSKDQPLHFAINSNAKRLTPNLFAFWNRTRSTNYTSLETWDKNSADEFEWAFGDSARDQCLRFPKLCLKGLPLNNKSYFTLRGYEIAAMSIQSFIQSISQAERINDSIEVAIAIPPSMSPREKSFLYAALSISNIHNLTALQFIDTTTAPAQVYALEKYKGEKDKIVAFVDVGGSGTRVSIFKFDNSTGTTNITQLAVQFDESMGGEILDHLLAEKMAKKYNVNMENLKTRVNFIDDISMVKEMLTVHPSVDLKFEDDDDIDEKLITVTRKDFESIGENMVKTIEILSHLALAQANLKTHEIHEIEMIGGCSHIPFVEEAIKKAFNTTKLNHKLNADSAIAIGAGYSAAKLSKEFIVRPTNSSFMLTLPVIVRSAHKVYKVYDQGDSEDSSPAIQTKVNPHQTFSIETGNSNTHMEPYMEFELKDLGKATDVEISFIHNYFLMPVPMSASSSNNNNYEFEFKDIGWEVPATDLAESRERINYLIHLQKLRREKEIAANNFEAELLKLENFVYDAQNVTQEEIEKIKKIVKEGMEWFENVTIHVETQEFLDRIQKVKEETSEIVERGTEFSRKPISVQKIKKTLGKAKKMLNDSISLGKVEPALQGDLLNEIKDVEKWINDSKDCKTFTSKEVDARRLELKKKMIPLKQKIAALTKKPKNVDSQYNEL